MGLPERARLVVASPPYLGLVRYGASNWQRARALCLKLVGRAVATIDDIDALEVFG